MYIIFRELAACSVTLKFYSAGYKLPEDYVHTSKHVRAEF
jgi:hypothetical protein